MAKNIVARMRVGYQGVDGLAGSSLEENILWDEQIMKEFSRACKKKGMTPEM